MQPERRRPMPRSESRYASCASPLRVAQRRATRRSRNKKAPVDRGFPAVAHADYFSLPLFEVPTAPPAVESGELFRDFEDVPVVPFGAFGAFSDTPDFEVP